MAQKSTGPMMRNIPPFGLRMQPELKDRIQAAADTNKRSMNAEIVARLEASFEPQQAIGSLYALGEKWRSTDRTQLEEISETTKKIIELLMRDEKAKGDE